MTEPFLATRAPINEAPLKPERIRCRNMKKYMLWIVFALPAFSFVLPAVETGMYRLLSISDSELLILVSQIPSKNKYLLDAASVKITVDGKAAEFSELKAFSVIQVKMELKKSVKNGIEIDGAATEIQITGTEAEK